MFVVIDIFYVVYVYVKFVYMRVLILLTLILLGSCAKQEPTYLKCDQGVSLSGVKYVLWVVLDHENSLWISSSFHSKPVEKYGKIGVFTSQLQSDERDYWWNNGEDNFYLDRASLVYKGSSNANWPCVIVDDLSHLRDLGLEKARIKI